MRRFSSINFIITRRKDESILPYGEYFQRSNYEILPKRCVQYPMWTGSKERGGYCFCGCTALRSVRLPKGLRELQRGVFSYSWSLKKIELPPALEKIKDRAFDNSGLTAIDIPESVSYIDMMGFMECEKLTDIKISASLARTLTVSDFKKIFDIEYKQEKRKKIKLTNVII